MVEIFGFECKACNDVTLWSFVVFIQLCLIGLLILTGVIFAGLTYTKITTLIDEIKVSHHTTETPPPPWSRHTANIVGNSVRTGM